MRGPVPHFDAGIHPLGDRMMRTAIPRSHRSSLEVLASVPVVMEVAVDPWRLLTALLWVERQLDGDR
jgi:hypothetical protein